MFENAELGTRMSKAEHKRAVERLRVELLEAQHALARAPRALVVVVAGVEGSGKTEFVNELLTWLDARGLEVHALDEPTDEERERPPFWRFWRLLPARGRTALFLTSWYTRPIVDRAFKRAGAATLDDELERIAAFESMLAREGVVLAKLWFHITKKDQGERLRALERRAATRWRVTPLDWEFHERYARFRKICERALRKTDAAESPWTIIEAADRRHRDVAGARRVLEALRAAAAEPPPAPSPRPARAAPRPRGALDALDLSLSLPKERFAKELEPLQERLGLLARRLKKERRSLILAFEGPDAAGKGGAIRRLTAAMDARLYHVNAAAAPTDEERARPYLWRFWRGLPRLGRVALYDRTWYGRVLVERVEGFAAPEEWRRAYGEINEFEEQLTDAGAILLKFWLQISPGEQLRRFKSRRATPYKQYKLTEDDWRNRRKWDAYQAAAAEMVGRTSTELAPWTLVEAEDKRWARIKILKTVVRRLEKALD